MRVSNELKFEIYCYLYRFKFHILFVGMFNVDKINLIVQFSSNLKKRFIKIIKMLCEFM